MAVPDQAGPSRVVSSDSESLILVDEQDNPIGFRSKGDCHDGDGLLHRAFSVFLFNPEGRLLIQQRAPGKRLWPGFWANSCCSHPRAGEDMDTATRRRVEEELGLTASLNFIYKFRYHARYQDLGSEHELCWVYAGRTTADRIRPNPSEISDWRFVDPSDVDVMVSDESAPVAPWFRMEWKALRDQYRDEVAKVVEP